VTTVFVTHDQEEAMDVADRIVVMADGEVKQVGSPDDLYDRPASEFVMSFLGPVTTLAGQLIRPHDLDVRTEPLPDAYAGRIADLTRVGFEVRLDIVLDNVQQPTPVHVTQTRAEAAAKRLAVGDRVWLKPVPGASQIPLANGSAPSALPELQPLVS
jgi:sulfate/thiosulfate transport system ATP-binding protein